MSDPKELFRMDEEAREKIRKRIDRNYFVEAGAGSGKTSCLVDRMTAMVESGIDVSRICAITFTKAAANEFYARFQKKLSERSRESDKGTTPESRARCREALKDLDLCFMGTIDSFCFTILQEHPAEAGVPFNAGVRAEDEMVDVWKREYARILGGEYLDEELEALAQDFVRIQEKPESVFLNCLKKLWGVRNGEIVFEGLEGTKPYELIKPLQDEIVPLLEWVLENEDWQSGITAKDPVKAFEELKKNIQMLKAPWVENFGQAMKILDGLKLLRISLEADVETGHRYAEKYFQVHLTRNRPAWYELVPGKNPDPESYPYVKALNRLQDLQYQTAMEFVTKAMAKMEKELKRQGTLSFFDCLYTLRDMLREDVKRDGRLIRHIAERHSYFLIDEFQDTNPMQAEVFFLLSAVEPDENWRECVPRLGSLFIVGDPKQSIYRFNQADIPAYRKVKELFRDDVGEVLYLTRNFRSTTTMKEWFNERFSEILSVDSEDRCLFHEIPMGEDEKPEDFSGVFRYTSRVGKDTPREEKDPWQVADQISRLVKNPEIIIRDKESGKPRELSFGDVMVITPTKTSLEEISKELSERRIPFRVEGKVVFKESPSFVAACDLFRYYGAPFESYYTLRGKRILRDGEAVPALQKSARWMSHTVLFRTILEEHRVFERFGFGNMEVTYYGLELLREAEQAGDLPTRKEAIRFLDGLLENPDIERSISLEYNSDRVHVANLHKIKGLESEAVILAKPYRQNKAPEFRTEYLAGEPRTYLFKIETGNGNNWDKRTIKTSGFKEECEAETESLAAEGDRLLYVAATRARSILVISEGLTEGGNVSNANPWNPLLKGVHHTLPDRAEPLNTEAEIVTAGDLAGEEDRIEIDGSSCKEASYHLLRPSKLELKSRISSEDDFEDREDEEIRTRDLMRNAARTGTLVHRLMEVLVKSRDTILPEAAVEGVLSEFGVEEAEYRSLLEKVCQQIRSGGYPQENGGPADILRELLSAEEVYCEMPFCFSEEGAEDRPETLWHGVMDVVYRKAGKWHIVDYKTNAEEEGLDEKYEGQLQAYEKAFRILNQDEGTAEAVARVYHIDV
ncbi:MAG: UvrD-helicase domain-containing protein [Firmicutes bacterium]|nr:UvrD-helicase domain-containing protein [Bacillota bacterium]